MFYNSSGKKITHFNFSLFCNSVILKLFHLTANWEGGKIVMAHRQLSDIDKVAVGTYISQKFWPFPKLPQPAE